MLVITIQGDRMLASAVDLTQYRKKLNSEIIAAKFGSYSVEVLFEDNQTRI